SPEAPETTLYHRPHSNPLFFAFIDFYCPNDCKGNASLNLLGHCVLALTVGRVRLLPNLIMGSPEEGSPSHLPTCRPADLPNCRFAELP
ncbi:MAG: hypothetical protein ACK4I8_12120, partial [Armatimonadota bacterium]